MRASLVDVVVAPGAASHRGRNGRRRGVERRARRPSSSALEPVATVPAGGTVAADGPAPGLVGTAALGGGVADAAARSAAVASAAWLPRTPGRRRAARRCVAVLVYFQPSTLPGRGLVRRRADDAERPRRARCARSARGGSSRSSSPNRWDSPPTGLRRSGTRRRRSSDAARPCGPRVCSASQPFACGPSAHRTLVPRARRSSRRRRPSHRCRRRTRPRASRRRTRAASRAAGTRAAPTQTRSNANSAIEVVRRTTTRSTWGLPPYRGPRRC